VGLNEQAGAKLAELVGVLVCFAVKEEAAALKKIAPDLILLDEILITGIGSRNAAEKLYPVLERRSFSLVLTGGFAGALNPELKVGDVLFDEDPGAKVAEILRAAGARPGTFHCAKRVAITVSEKAELRRSTGADAVEMESEVIRGICRERKIPSATVRVISDTANEDLPLDFNALMTADQELSFPKLALALMKSPGSIPRLRELQRNTQLASEKLAEVLVALFGALNDRRRAGAGGLGALI